MSRLGNIYFNYLLYWLYLEISMGRKNKLLVFIGKPGAGKSTLIKELNPDGVIIDVKTFVLAYEVNGQVPEEKTEQAYHDMYAQVMDKHEDLLVLEIGTNHPQVNVDEFKKLSSDWEIFIFICTASIDTLKKRIIIRPEDNDMAAMERRLQRNFPELHLSLLERASLPYVILDMEQPMTDNIILVNQSISYR